MAITLNVQNDQGLVANANAYVSVADFKAYHDDRGNLYTGKSDDQIASAIIKATDYVDSRFSYRGWRRNDTTVQTTQWPRAEAYDNDDRSINGVPPALKKAVNEYAMRALTGNLNPDPTVSSYGSAVKSFSRKTGPVEQSFEFANPGSIVMPRYPAADTLLTSAGLTQSSMGTTVRC